MSDRDELLGIIGYSAEVCEPNAEPITAFYTDRHLRPILDKLVAYVETARADERERIAQDIEAMPGTPNAGTRDAAARMARNGGSHE